MTNHLTFNNPNKKDLLNIMGLAYKLIKETDLLAIELKYPDKEAGLVDIYWIEDELLWEINHGITLEKITLKQYTGTEFEDIFKTQTK